MIVTVEDAIKIAVGLKWIPDTGGFLVLDEPAGVIHIDALGSFYRLRPMPGRRETI